MCRVAFMSVAMLTLVAACQQAPEPAAAEAPSNVKVLQTFPAGAAFFQLTLGPCEKTECRLAVRLLEANRVEDTFALPVAAGTQPARSEVLEDSGAPTPGFRRGRSGKSRATWPPPPALSSSVSRATACW